MDLHQMTIIMLLLVGMSSSILMDINTFRENNIGEWFWGGLLTISAIHAVCMI